MQRLLLEGPMSPRLTERARHVVALASAEARKLKHAYIGTEHILLALVREGTGVAAKALESVGVDAGALREQIEQVVAAGPEEPESGALPMTPKANKVLEIASQQAEMMGHPYIGTEHILLGLILEEHGIAAQVLQSMGVELAQVRECIDSLLGGMTAGAQEQEPDALPDAPPIDLDEEDEAGVTLSDDEQLCLDALNEVEELKALARAAGRILRQKEAAVSEEDFERAAVLRDALVSLNVVAADAQKQWPEMPDVSETEQG